MMSCECYQVGGRFIAEDPDCPAHGRDAQAAERSLSSAKDRLRYNIDQATTVEDLRHCLYDLLEML
jgi:hypothetical protein